MLFYISYHHVLKIITVWGLYFPCMATERVTLFGETSLFPFLTFLEKTSAIVYEEE